MGLREAKKRRARSAIIENAISLFRQQGFEATTVREIVGRCDLSEATFFNYFGSKEAVLGEWAQDGVEAVFGGAADEGQRGLRPALRSVCVLLARAVEDDREFAARAWARARLPLAAPAVLVEWLEQGQQGGVLRRDLSPRQMGEILYVSVCGTIASWLVREGPPGSLAPELRRAVDLVVDGGRRRNERVRPAATTGASGSVSTR